MMLGLEDEARVEKLKDEYVTSADLEDQQIEKWEKLKLGHSQVHRLSRVGRDAVNIRMQKLINKSNATGEKVEEDPFLQEHRDRSAAYFSNTGKAMLQMQIYVEQEEKETRKWSNKALEAGKLLRRKVKVSEQEEDAADGPKKRQSLSIDKDWDTASWSDEQICAGMDYLFYIFVDPIYSQNDQHKALAVQMIDRLLVRSPAACAHFLEQLESIVSRAISRFIRLGKSAAQLDLLFILHVGRERFVNELSGFSFGSRAMEMVLLECRLASILIQHTFRAYAAKKRVVKANNYSAISRTFGGDMHMRFLRETAVRARGVALRQLWASFHSLQTTVQRLTPSGFRGPCHLPPKFTHIVLDMVHTMVSPIAGKNLQGNREDLVSTGGSIMLAAFISHAIGPFASKALQVCVMACKVAAAMQPMLESGIVAACLRYMNYLESLGKLQWLLEGTDGLQNRRDMSKAAYAATQVPKLQWFDCILIITRIATHVAGIFRAREAYDNPVPPTNEVESISYRKLLQAMHPPLTPHTVRSVLGHRKLLYALGSLIIKCNHLFAMRALLLCVYTICCSEGQEATLTMVVADSSRVLARLLELTEESDMTVATLATCICLQLATQENARDVLLSRDAITLLGPRTKCRPPNYHLLSYCRNIHIAAALLRQHTWRAYDPETFPAEYSHPETIRRLTYIDLLRSTRPMPRTSLPLKPEEEKEINWHLKLGIADLCVLPEDTHTVLEYSITAESCAAREIAEFLVRPGAPMYVDKLPWEEAVAGCVILDCLCRHPATAASVFSTSVVYYLGRCLFILRWMFASGAMKPAQLQLVLVGVKAAAQALKELALGVHLKPFLEEQMLEVLTDLVEPAQFFIGNLGSKQPDLEFALLQLQRHASLAVLDYLRCHMSMMVRSCGLGNGEGEGPDPNDGLLADSGESLSNVAVAAQLALRQSKEKALMHKLQVFEPVGREILTVIKKASNVYEREPDRLLLVVDKACGVLEVLSGPAVGAATLCTNWESGKALKELLPPPLSSVASVDSAEYKNGLGRLSPALVRLIANLCQTQQGLSDTLVNGYLSATLAKVDILYPIIAKVLLPGFETDPFEPITQGVNSGGLPQFPPVLAEQTEQIRYITAEVASCILLFARCANFASQTSGSSNDMMLRPQHRLFERIALILQVRQPAPQDENANISATPSRSSSVSSREPSRPSSAALHEHVASVTTKAASSPATGLSSLRNNIPDTIAETSSVNSLSSADKLLQGPRGTEMNEVSPAEGNENDFGIENMGTGLGTKANEMSKIWKQFRGRPNRNQLERFWAQFVPWDELQAAAMRALTALCSDSVRLFQQIESLDIIRLIRGILLRIDIVPKEYLGNCCNCIEYIARGLRTDYLKDNLPTLRIPLQSIPTKHPSLLGLTRQASWTVMKATLDQEKAAAARASKLGLPPPTANWEPDNFDANVDSILHARLRSLLQESGMTFKEAQLEAPSQGSTPRTAGSGATALKSENMTFSPIRQPTPSSLFNATVPQMQTTEMSIQMGQSNTSNKVPTDDTLATPPAPSLRAPQPVPLQPEAHSSRTQTPTTQGDSYINTGVSKMQNSKNDLRQLSAEDMNAPPSQKKTIGFVQKKRHDLQSATSNSGKHSSQYKIPGSPIRRRAPTGAVHHLQAQPLVIDISKTPEFLMSRPPVFKLKADDAFIC